jgi:murein DD-endopeptidase MepM/ murein hydrolase activator NlpD
MRITSFYFTGFLAASLSHPVHSAIDYITAFEDIHANVVWPAPGSSTDDISSTFGPRIKLTCSCYDFHRGVDIHGVIGDDVVASYGGKVKRKMVLGGGGLTLILEHSFADWTKLHEEGPSTNKWYTVYMHLHDTLVDGTQVEEGDFLEAGDIVAHVGMSGSATHAHLHHEVRVGTRCSLEYALDHPSSTCNTKN